MSSSKSSNKRARTSAGSRSSAATLAESEAAIPLGKYLASTEKRVRDGAIKSLGAFLATSGAEPIPAKEMAKLWKGIFYCFWMSDKPLVQQALAQELSDLLLLMPTSSEKAASMGESDVNASSISATKAGKARAVEGFEGDTQGIRLSARSRASLAFLEGFWDSIVREWNGIDRLRMDKFYLLLRRFTNASFRLLATEQWDPAAVTDFLRLLQKEGGPLCPNDIKVPNSITFHLADIYLDELEKAVIWQEGSQAEGGEEAGSSDEEESQLAVAPVPILELLSPFIGILATCHSGTVYDRVLSNVIQPFLDDCLKASPRLTSEAGRPHKRSRLESSSPEEGDYEELRFPQTLAAAAVEEEGEEEEGSEEVPRPTRLRAAIFKALLEAASRPEAQDPRRRRLYALWRDEQDRLAE